MKPRAVLTKSAPTHSAHAARAEVTSLPEATTRDAVLQARTRRARRPRAAAPRRSTGPCGRRAPAAPRRCRPRRRRSRGSRARTRGRARSTCSAMSFRNCQPPIAVLMPTGRPVSSRMQRDLVEQLGRCSAMSRWRFGLIESSPCGNAADRRDLLGDLAARQHAALAGLRALRELDLERLHVLVRAISRASRDEGCRAASRMPYFAVPICMITSQPPSRWYGDEAALAGVHPAAGHRGAARQRAHRGLRDRAEAHAADVDDRARDERVRAVALADRERRRRHALLLQHRERAR